jgi:putative oxidoreductase
MSRKVFLTTPDLTLTVARVILAVIFFAHGSQKMFGLFGGRGFSGTLELFHQTMGIPPALTVLAMVAEVFGSIGLLLGFLSRIAAFGVLVVMGVAVFANGLYPRFFMNWTGAQRGEGFEYHLLAIALILGILVRGGGAWSLDHVISSRSAAASSKAATASR